MRTRVRFFFLCLALLVAASSVKAEPLRVGVAANFASTLENLLNSQPSFPTQVSISVAATGALATQIKLGAPFDIFLGADESRPMYVFSAQPGHDRPVCYAQGRLIFLGAKTLNELSGAGRLAIANPDIAPYGRAAMEILTRYPVNSMKVIKGASALQAYQFYASSNVDYALVPASLAKDSGLLIPSDWHRPIAQFGMALAKSGEVSQEARAFMKWLLSEPVQEQLADMGYESCQND
jgi:molybdate transport system substrate-binding protein